VREFVVCEGQTAVGAEAQICSFGGYVIGGEEFPAGERVEPGSDASLPFRVRRLIPSPLGAVEAMR
jgi:hypothetical protein